MSLKESIRVMVVDDMSTSRGLIVQALDEIGILHSTTENEGKSALTKLVANPVHLVLSDFNMPTMNGLELLQALRQNKTTQRIGFILITGKATPEILNIGKKLGMNNYIQKPFKTADMKQCIERVVGKL